MIRYSGMQNLIRRWRNLRVNGSRSDLEWIAFEPLEPRVLLSADLSPDLIRENIAQANLAIEEAEHNDHYGPEAKVGALLAAACTFRYIPGDIDRDGDVDFHDFSVLAANFTGTLDPGAGQKTGADGDVDGDGDVDFKDFSTLASNFTGTLGDGHAPIIRAGLHNDTGVDSSDGITFDPTVSGAVTDDVAITAFCARIDGSTVEEFTDVREHLLPNGSFTLGLPELNAINDDVPLDDGVRTVHLIAQDKLGRISTPTEISLTLDTTPPEPRLFDPQDNGVISRDFGYIDVRWTDFGLAIRGRRQPTPISGTLTSTTRSAT